MEFTASQIASIVGGKVEGDPNAVVSTFAKIEEGHPGALSFLANPKYAHYIYNTGSSIVLVNEDFEPEQPISTTLIRVKNAYETVAQLLQMVTSMTQQHPTGIEQPCHIAEGVEIPANAYVGTFTYIGHGAKIGQEAKIYPQAYVGPGVEIGDGTIIYPGVKIYKGCKIGARCIIHSGAVIGADGFGFAPKEDGSYDKIPQTGIVEIEDDVEIGANTTIDRAMMGATRIRHGVKLDNLIQIAHNVEVGHDTVMASQVGVAGSAKIGSRCMMGGQVGIAGHITVGDGTQVGAQAGIPNSVKPGSAIIGSPAIPGRDFALQCARLKRLGDLFDRVRELEKKVNP
ncbi:MAG: UDP-3-O-(3-hydroxymyristoyl)glucosamine N-acyltransferase [Bacteroidales bacterium]|nr:UDP-3-O-(3-hydroxymyristoyl)glucosamine N-acyltransferase [Bacteroidales bacterium]